MSGKSRKSPELQRTELNRAVDDALKPLTSKTRDEMDVMRRKVKLQPREQGECRQLDSRLPELDAATRRNYYARKGQADVALYQARKRYFYLGC